MKDMIYYPCGVMTHRLRTGYPADLRHIPPNKILISSQTVNFKTVLRKLFMCLKTRVLESQGSTVIFMVGCLISSVGRRCGSSGSWSWGALWRKPQGGTVPHPRAATGQVLVRHKRNILQYLGRGSSHPS